jgi:putative ABC transport system substrate-binding protein
MSPVRKAVKTEKTGVFCRILVPTDLTDGAARSLKLALALARDSRATVTLVHVVQQVPGLPPGEMRTFYDRLIKRSRHRLASTAKLFAARGMTVRSQVVIGEPAQEIVRAAAVAGADVIIMGSHKVNPKRRGMGWGTTSYKVGILAVARSCWSSERRASAGRLRQPRCRHLHPRMDRRRFLLTSLASLAAPLAAEAQEAGKVYRIGLLSPYSSAESVSWHQAFRRGLRDLGWIEGQNITIEPRYANGRNDRLPGLVADLVGLKVDIIVTAVTPDTLAAKKGTNTIPIVMASPGDPVVTGIVTSLARPGGNITGLSQVAPDLVGKRVELLKEIVPKLSRVAVLWNPNAAVSALSWRELESAARALGVQLHSLEVRSADELDKAFRNATKARAEALVILPNAAFVPNLKRIADHSLQARLPSSFHLREFADAGGLVAYGPDRSDLFRRAASYVDKILKGAKPADLPIEQPTKFELLINLKTAKALGLTIPPSLLARADQIIE